MRILLIVVLALVAIGAAGVWVLGEFGPALWGASSEARAPLVIEPEIVDASDTLAAPAAPNADTALRSHPTVETPASEPTQPDGANTPATPPAGAVLAERFDGAPRSQPADPTTPPEAEPTGVAQSQAANADTAPATSELQAQFKSRKVTYNRPPEKLALNKPTDISLIIDTAGDANAAARIADLPGTVVERDVELSDFVAAELIGADFDIEPQTAATRQKLSPKLPNEWRWRVTPTAEGRRTLTLTIYGYATGSLDAEPLAAYRDEIVVEVKQFDQIVTWARSVQPVFAVLAALAGAASALFAFLRFREEKKRARPSA